MVVVVLGARAPATPLGSPATGSPGEGRAGPEGAAGAPPTTGWSTELTSFTTGVSTGWMIWSAGVPVCGGWGTGPGGAPPGEPPEPGLDPWPSPGDVPAPPAGAAPLPLGAVATGPGPSASCPPGAAALGPGNASGSRPKAEFTRSTTPGRFATPWSRATRPHSAPLSPKAKIELQPSPQD